MDPSRPKPARPTPSRSLTNSLAIARLQAWLQRLDRRRIIAIVMAMVVAVIAYGAVARARQTVDALGATQPVAVAIDDIDAGAELTLDNIRVESRPVGHVPEGAIGPDAIGRRTASAIVSGEVVVQPRVLSGSEAIGSSERAVTIPMPLAPPPLEIGDVVELIGVVAADGPFGASARQLASGRVIAFDEEAITVATPSAQAMEVITHLGAGAVEVLLTPFDNVRPSEGVGSAD